MPTITCVITLTQRVREPELDQRRVVLRDVAERAAARTRRDRQLYPLGIAGGLSEYEQQHLRNIAKNHAALVKLGLADALRKGDDTGDCGHVI